jgi:hypothetical protein
MEHEFSRVKGAWKICGLKPIGAIEDVVIMQNSVESVKMELDTQA